jgi:hypothetical protein
MIVFTLTTPFHRQRRREGVADPVFAALQYRPAAMHKMGSAAMRR